MLFVLGFDHLVYPLILIALLIGSEPVSFWKLQKMIKKIVFSHPSLNLTIHLPSALAYTTSSVPTSRCIFFTSLYMAQNLRSEHKQ